MKNSQNTGRLFLVSYIYTSLETELSGVICLLAGVKTVSRDFSPSFDKSAATVTVGL